MIGSGWVFLGAALTLAGALSYARETVRGRTQPNRVTWLMWTLAPTIAGVAQLSEGVGTGAVLAFSVGLGPFIIFVSTFVSAHAHARLGPFDIGCGVLSLLALMLWLTLDSGTVAIVMSILADGFGALPTVTKSLRAPETEHPGVFRNSALNGAIALASIHHWTFAAWSFPAWILFICLLLYLLIRLRIGPRLLARRTAVQAA